MSTNDINLPPLRRPQVPRIDADIDPADLRRLVDWCEKTARSYARAAVRAARQSQDKEDAERYRRLRKGDIDDVAVVQGLGAMDYGASAVIGTYSVEIDGDDLDAAIDHARRVEGGGE